MGGNVNKRINNGITNLNERIISNYINVNKLELEENGNVMLKLRLILCVILFINMFYTAYRLHNNKLNGLKKFINGGAILTVILVILNVIKG